MQPGVVRPVIPHGSAVPRSGFRSTSEEPAFFNGPVEFDGDVAIASVSRGAHCRKMLLVGTHSIDGAPTSGTHSAEQISSNGDGCETTT